MNDFELSNNTDQTEVADSWQQGESLLNFSLTPIPSLEMNPKTDMTVLCPNCHSMIHRKKSKTLTIEELKAIYKK